MGFERITEKDFWKCSEGAAYAPIQGTRKSTTLQSGEAFITEADTATLSWIDFGCTKNMIWNAIKGAVVAVVAVVVITVLVVGTGGLALGPLMLVGAAAATYAGIVTAIEGALKCGQKKATAREWNERDQNLISQGIRTITGDRFMTCKIGGVVQYAPEVKSWDDAIALTGLNYITKLTECALGGLAVGAAGYLIPSLAGGQIAFAAPTWASVATNVGTGFAGEWGATRVLFGIDALANDSAMGKVNNGWDALDSFGNAAVPEIGMGQRILTGQAQPTDFLIFLYLLNFKPGRNATPPPEEGNLQNRQQGERNNNNRANEGEGRAYEADPPGTYRDKNGRLHDSETNQFVEDPRTQQNKNNATNTSSNGDRPSWRQSEIDAENMFPGYDTQKSFINGKEVPYGTEGSTRPDLYSTGHSIEVKNYNIETASGRNNLNSELTRQYTQRVSDLPQGTRQTTVVDVRGQNYTPQDLVSLESNIKSTCPDLEVIFME